ncbi:hypothetical protein Tco_1104666 [Tanacetum coccineum]
MKQRGSSGTGSLPSGRVDLTDDEDPTDEDGDTGMGDSTGVSVSLVGEISSGGKKSQETGSLYPKTYWELLPKEILGATTQRDTGSYYPKRYWELLPKEILGAITQRETGMSYGKMEVTRTNLEAKVVMEVLGRLIGDVIEVLEEAHNEDTQRNLKFTSEDQVRGGLLGIIVNRLKSGSYRDSYLRDILGKDMHYRDVLGKDMHYPFTFDLDIFKLAIVLQKAKQIQDFGPTSGIKASRGTLTSFHEDASDNGTASNKPKQQQQQLIPTTTTISNIKLPILKKKEYDIWEMKMEHYLEYIDNDVWKVIQNGNYKKRISTGKDGVIRVLPPVSAAEIHAVEKERKAITILLMAIPKEHLRRFHGMDDAKEI